MATANNTVTRMKALHERYVALTGMVVRLDMQREGMWFEWMRRGWGVEDLELVVAQVRRGIREGKRNVGALKFSNLVGQVDYFEEDLALARALGRIVKPNAGRAEVLRVTGRPAEGQGAPARQIGTVMGKAGEMSDEGRRAFEEFCKLKGRI